MPLIDRVRAFVQRHQLFDPDTRVVAAVSGGSDSVALAHLLAELAGAGEVRLAGLAHFNHQLRQTAARDEQAAAGVAATLGVPIEIGRGDVAARARRERRSIEEAARASRYEFFEAARARFGADRVALGHTRDDQAETVLLRMVRGAGTRGLGGMHPRRGAVIRPLLACRRDALRVLLAGRGIAYVDDESNADVSIPRNRVRAELVPLLRDRFNPAIVDVLADQAELAQEQWDWMQQASTELLAGQDPFELDISTLRRAPAALARLVVWRAMSEVAQGRLVAFKHVDAAMRLMESDHDAAIDIPGQRVERRGARLRLAARPPGLAGRWRPEAADRAPANLFAYSLSIPGEVQVPEAACRVSVAVCEEGSATHGTADGRSVAHVRLDRCQGPLGVRNRRPGDKFSPIGLGGRKTLQDFFVDRKVPRERRNRVPIVVDQTGRIVWVAGHGIDEAFRVTDASQGMLVFRLTRVGGI